MMIVIGKTSRIYCINVSLKPCLDIPVRNGINKIQKATIVSISAKPYTKNEKNTATAFAFCLTCSSFSDNIIN